MDSSILLSVAENVLGSVDDLDAFRTDLLMYINSALMTLNQRGVGHDNFYVTGDTETWNDFVDDVTKYAALPECVAMKVRLAFDPPASSAAMDSLEKLIDQAEFRLSIQADEMRRGNQ